MSKEVNLSSDVKSLTQIKAVELVESTKDWQRFSTNVDNTFVYRVQVGWGYTSSILHHIKDKREKIYGTKAVILNYQELIDGRLECFNKKIVVSHKDLEGIEEVDFSEVPAFDYL